MTPTAASTRERRVAPTSEVGSLPDTKEGSHDAPDELARLISEQEKDAQWGHRVYQGASLDREFEEGGSFHDVVGYGATGESATRKIDPPNKWTRRAIISAIRRWTAEHGEPPRYNEWRAANGRGIPPCVTVQRRFGTWNAAIEAAGFETRGIGGIPAEVPNNRGKSRMRSQRPDTYLSHEQIASAYKLYQRASLSMPELAERLWRKFGYSSPMACRNALWRGFHSEGFELRTRAEAGRIAKARRKKSA